MRRRLLWRCSLSNGFTEDPDLVLEIAAYDAKGAEQEYRNRLGDRIHVLDPVMVFRIEET
jgi:hypothetical protein